jgi:hypothetical protein
MMLSFFMLAGNVRGMRSWGFRERFTITRYKICQRVMRLANHLNPNYVLPLVGSCPFYIILVSKIINFAKSINPLCTEQPIHKPWDYLLFVLYYYENREASAKHNLYMPLNLWPSNSELNRQLGCVPYNGYQLAGL